MLDRRAKRRKVINFFLEKREEEDEEDDEEEERIRREEEEEEEDKEEEVKIGWNDRVAVANGAKLKTRDAAVANQYHLNLWLEAIKVPNVWIESFAITEYPARLKPTTV